MNNTIVESNNKIISLQLKTFVSSLKLYSDEYEGILMTISKNLPKIEMQIDKNVLEARKLLNFLFSSDNIEHATGVKHELDQFHRLLNCALKTMSDSEIIDKSIFSDLRKTIDISKSAVSKINEIYNISEDLKVFAINSIVYSQKEGNKGKGYQIISGEFIRLSEQIAAGTENIEKLGQQMNSVINEFHEQITEYENFTHRNIEYVSRDSKKILEKSDKSVRNFSIILNDLLHRIESVKAPAFDIMVELQKQDIIQQQIVHLMDAVDDILRIIDETTASVDTVEVYTLLKILLITVEKQMFRINNDSLAMINVLDGKVSDINSSLSDLNSDKKMIGQTLVKDYGTRSEATIVNLIFEAPAKTIMDITDTLSEEIITYTSLFNKLRSQHNEMENKIFICSELLAVIEEKLETFGGAVNINDCVFKDVIIQKIVEKLTVDEERVTLNNEFAELEIEESTGSNITLF